MKLIINNKVEINLTKEQAKCLQDEMRYAVNCVSVFPVMEEILNVMEA